MKNAIIFHGTSGTPNHFWHPYLKTELEKRGYKVWVPQLPDTDHPNLKNWLPFAIEHGRYDGETIVVGHSAGGPLILSILENLNVKIKLAVLVAGFFETLKKIDKEPILQKSYDWKKIRSNAEHFVFINSDNDPWGCDDKQGRKLFDQLGGDLVIRHEGHMGSETYNQPYKTFPLLVKLIEAYK